MREKEQTRRNYRSVRRTARLITKPEIHVVNMLPLEGVLKLTQVKRSYGKGLKTAVIQGGAREQK